MKITNETYLSKIERVRVGRNDASELTWRASSSLLSRKMLKALVIAMKLMITKLFQYIRPSFKSPRTVRDIKNDKDQTLHYVALPHQ